MRLDGLLILGILMELFVRELREDLIILLNQKYMVVVDNYDDMFYRITLYDREEK